VLLTACHAHGPASAPKARQGEIAYTVQRSTSWWQAGDVHFTLAHGATSIATWTRHVGEGKFADLSRPSFTTDGKYAFARYSDENAGRVPYDGEDIHAQLAWIDVTDREVRDVPIPARSRTAIQKPWRPGVPFALRGSTVVWQAPPDADYRRVALMQLDLSQTKPAPTVLWTIDLPALSGGERRAAGDEDLNGFVVGAGHGRVVVARSEDPQSVRLRTEHLFIVDADGGVRDLGRQPALLWGNAIFSADGSRFAYETGKTTESGYCQEHQVVVFDSATGRPAAGFPPGPFDVGSKPYFYGNTSNALWWTPDGKLRATGSADHCPASPSEPTPDGGVWEFSGSAWTQIDPPGTYRDYPLPSGAAAVVAETELPPDERRPNESSTVTSLFIRERGRLSNVARIEPAGVATAPPSMS
jgi:hypothetical protein